MSVAKDVKYRSIHRRAHQKGHSTKYKVCALVRTLRMRGKNIIFAAYFLAWHDSTPDRKQTAGAHRCHKIAISL